MENIQGKNCFCANKHRDRFPPLSFKWMSIVLDIINSILSRGFKVCGRWPQVIYKSHTVLCRGVEHLRIRSTSSWNLPWMLQGIFALKHCWYCCYSNSDLIVPGVLICSLSALILLEGINSLSLFY